MIILHATTKKSWSSCENLDFYGEHCINNCGFIHCSDIDTYHLVAPKFKNEVEEMVILVINTCKVSSKILWEDFNGTGVSFPHIYGMLNKDAIVTILPHIWNKNKEWVPNRELIFPTLTIKEAINKGHSKDKKLIVFDENENKLLLRISPFDSYEAKHKIYEITRQAEACGVPMCAPVSFGICNEGVYTLQSWIDGTDGDECINKLTFDKQYRYGIDAGKALKKIHSIAAPREAKDWESYFNCKIDGVINAYNECPIKLKNDQTFINYINSHRHLLAERPLVYQHGDYHIGNMRIGFDEMIYIIDFEKVNIGDPWEEFKRIVWCAGSSPFFATGMINGYFDNNVPVEFWDILLLYICFSKLSAITWAGYVERDLIDLMKNQADEVLCWYNNMQSPIPTWYKGIRNDFV